MSLNGKRVVIIGGTSGIGLATAHAAVDAGAEVVVASSRQASIDAALGELSASTTGRTLDVLDSASVQAFFAEVGAFERFLHGLADPTASGNGQPVLARPGSDRLHLIATRRSRPNRLDLPPLLVRGHRGGVLDELRQFDPQSVSILRAQVDLETRAVKTQLDRCYVVGRAVKVVDKECPGDCCHTPNIPEWLIRFFRRGGVSK